jgi:hypothetical protein
MKRVAAYSLPLLKNKGKIVQKQASIEAYSRVRSLYLLDISGY